MYTTIRAAVAFAAMALAAGCGGGLDKVNTPAAPTSAAPATLQVGGTVSVPAEVNPGDPDTSTVGLACVADDGYDDIDTGAQVVVTDEAGTTLGIGDLGIGILTTSSGDSTGPADRCQFQFAVSDVPTGKKFYGVHVGNQARGILRYTADQITEPLTLTIG